MKILHVDSDLAFAKHLQGETMRHGGVLCDLEHSSAIDEALERIQDERFDVVVVDPFSQAEPVVTCATFYDAAPDLPILALTTMNDTAVAIEALCAGAHDYLIKEETPAVWLMRRARYAVERCKYQSRRKHITGPHSRALNQTVSRSFSTVVAGHASSSAESAGIVHLRHRTEQVAEIARDRNPLDGPVRILHVEDDPTFARLARKFLNLNTPVQFDITHVEKWGHVAAALEQNQFDAVLLDLSLPDRHGVEMVSDVLPISGDVSVLVLSARDDDAGAIEAMQVGAEDFLIKDAANMRFLGRAILLSVARRNRRRLNTTSLESGDGGDTVVGQKPSHRSAPHLERRKHSRYLVTRPAFVIPIRPDQSPAETYSADGISVDVSSGGLKLELRGIDRLPTKYLLVGIENKSTVTEFATFEAQRVVPLAGRLSIGGQFIHDEHDLLRRENLEPSFHADSKRYQTGLPVDVLAKWSELGILRPTLMDRILLCPQCQSVATFRKGCRVCGSVRLHSRPLVHHFACAHVGFVSDFEQEDGVVCPKCRTRNMIVGADYEHLSGPFRCLDCDWSDTELDLVGQCLRCSLRFPANQALEEDLIGYHVERLDPLAVINAT
jgi:DNA-binding response OmpR family regulator